MVRPPLGPRKSHTIRMREELYGLVTAKAVQTGKTINDVCVDALEEHTSDVGEVPRPRTDTNDDVFMVQVPDDMLEVARSTVGIADAPAWLRERMRRGIQLERGINASIDIAASRMAAAALPAPEGAGPAAEPAGNAPEPAETAPEQPPDAPAEKPKKRRWWRRRRKN